MMKSLHEASKENPALAAELAELMSRHAEQLRALALKHGVELPPAAIADDDLDDLAGGARPSVGVWHA